MGERIPLGEHVFIVLANGAVAYCDACGIHWDDTIDKKSNDIVPCEQQHPEEKGSEG